MYTSEASQDHVILNENMASKCRIICKCAVIIDEAIMGYVHIGHEKIIIADPRNPTALLGTAIQRTVLPNKITLTYLQPGRLIFVTQVLGRIANRTKLEYPGAAADRSIPSDDRVRPDPYPVVDLYIGPNN